jgi:hypothetical protein
MVIKAYAQARPYLYHLTDRSNLDHICETNNLLSAAIFMERAGRTDLLRVRRRGHERVTVANRVILIRDQAPLHRGNVSLPRGYTFEQFVESLNRRIFFWPGTDAGPISYGVRHFERYQPEHPAILKIDFQSLIDSNPAAYPRYCRFNSGSPRCSYGQKSPRGPNTFLSADQFSGTPSKVVEVTFDGPLVLPEDTKVGRNPAGPWCQLSTFVNKLTK